MKRNRGCVHIFNDLTLTRTQSHTHAKSRETADTFCHTWTGLCCPSLLGCWRLTHEYSVGCPHHPSSPMLIHNDSHISHPKFRHLWGDGEEIRSSMIFGCHVTRLRGVMQPLYRYSKGIGERHGRVITCSVYFPSFQTDAKWSERDRNHMESYFKFLYWFYLSYELSLLEGCTSTTFSDNGSAALETSSTTKIFWNILTITGKNWAVGSITSHWCNLLQKSRKCCRMSMDEQTNFD